MKPTYRGSERQRHKAAARGSGQARDPWVSFTPQSSDLERKKPLLEMHRQDCQHKPVPAASGQGRVRQ